MHVYKMQNTITASLNKETENAVKEGKNRRSDLPGQNNSQWGQAANMEKNPGQQ